MTTLYDYMKDNGIESADVYDATLGDGTCMSVWDDPEDAPGCVSDHILKHTEFIGIDPSAPHDLDGNFWKFADEHYDQLRELLTTDTVNDEYVMTGEDREEDLERAVVVIFEIIKGNASNRVYRRYMEIFDLIPEDCVVYDFKVMDIDSYLAAEERKEYEFLRGQEE